MAKNKEQLTAQQIKGLKKTLRLNPNFSAQGKLGEFFDSYLLCEATARKLVYYKTGKDNITLYTSSIDSALKRFFPNNFSGIPVNKVFASRLKTNRNNKTAEFNLQMQLNSD